MDEEDEIAVSERQKQQERFREAQEIQREMSQIELQYEEFEEIAREIEQNLRDAEGSKCSLSLSLLVLYSVLADCSLWNIFLAKNNVTFFLPSSPFSFSSSSSSSSSPSSSLFLPPPSSPPLPSQLSKKTTS